MARTLKQRYYDFKRKAGSFWGLIAGSVFLGLTFVLSVVMYMTVEGWDFIPSFYMTVITLSTVGFMEVNPLSDTGRILTALVILGGVGGFAYIAASFAQLIAEGKLQQVWGRRRVKKTIDSLEGHFIVCGYGRIGSIVVDEIRKADLDVVVLEMNEGLIQRMHEKDILCIEGDATDDKILMAAGLMKARALITALTAEAANVYVTLTARQLNPVLQIIARANDRSHITRLELAGADRVVMPHLIGGVRMAQSVLRPTVTNFMELAIRGSIDLQMEELPVSSQSELAEKNLMESNLRPRFNLIIIGIKGSDGHMVFNPGPKEVIRAGDTLLAVGRQPDLHDVKDIL